DRPFQMTRGAMEIMCAYDWPGNVRELENAVERAAALCDSDVIQTGDLPPSILASVQPGGIQEKQEAAVALPNVPDSALYPLRTAESAGSTETTRPSTEPLMPLKSFMHQQEQAHLNRVLQQCN